MEWLDEQDATVSVRGSWVANGVFARLLAHERFPVYLETVRLNS